MMNMTPELIEKAKTAKTPEELLELARAEQVELTAEEAAEYFEMINPKMGELDDDDLENVSGGGCKTKVGGKNRTVVTAGLHCFNGQWERVMTSNGGREWRLPGNVDNGDLRYMWAQYADDRECGTCKHLQFKGGIGYCGKS